MEGKTIKRQRIYKVIMLVILTIIITFMITTITMYERIKETFATTSTGSTSTNNSELALVKTLESFKAMISQKYIGEMNEESMIEGAIKGYVEGIGDPYTTYLTKEEMSKFKEESSSEYIGIGVYIANNTVDNTVLVISVIKNTPALEAGIQEGDIITKVDGVEYKGEQLEEVSNALKTEEGKESVVTVLRDGKEIEFNIKRSKITVPHVASEMLEDNIGYIEIDSFDSNVGEEFQKQITTLKDNGANGIIIDLRSNGGGIVDEAIEVIDLFVKKDETVLITKSKNAEDAITKSKNDPIITDIPVVVLVNETTASASEILAAALKENYGATIVGKKTYGKGVIQTLYSLTDGSGIKITTDEYYTPKHNKINGVGIQPDVEVDLTVDSDGYYETGIDKDAQILKALEVLKK